jgi:hypothetical protein
MRHLFYAACFFEAGLLLMVLPWTVLWDRNALLAMLPWVNELSHNPYVRGAVTGLGLVNVGIGISEVGRLVAERFGRPAEGRPELSPRSDPRG